MSLDGTSWTSGGRAESCLPDAALELELEPAAVPCYAELAAALALAVAEDAEVD